MGIKATLTLEFHEVDQQKRKVFSDYMESKYWRKLSQDGKIWTVIFKEDTNFKKALQLTKERVKNGAITAKISEYEASVNLVLEEEHKFSNNDNK